MQNARGLLLSPTQTIRARKREVKAENKRLKEKYNIASYECNNLRELKTKYRQALQEIREYATDLIDGAAGGCEPDIGTILLKRIDEVIGEKE